MTTIAPDGQFDDEPEDVGYARIDDTALIDLTLHEENEYDDVSEEYDQVIQVRVEDEDWEVAEKGIYLHNSLIFSACAMCRLDETIQPSKAAPRRVIKRTFDNILVIGTLGDTKKSRMVIFLTVIGYPRMAIVVIALLAWIEAMGVKVEQG